MRSTAINKRSYGCVAAETKWSWPDLLHQDAIGPKRVRLDFGLSHCSPVEEPSVAARILVHPIEADVPQSQRFYPPDGLNLGVVRTAERILYRACAFVYLAEKRAVENYWWTSTEKFPILFREVVALGLPQLNKRAALPLNSGDVYGALIGLGWDKGKRPLIRSFPGAEQVCTLVRDSLREQLPGFSYTTILVTDGMRSNMHIDTNLGPSLILKLGPHFGGWTWTSADGHGVAMVSGQWNMFDAAIPHCSAPFYGRCVAIVLFTHPALLLTEVNNSPHPTSWIADISATAATPLRTYTRPPKCIIDRACSKYAEECERLLVSAEGSPTALRAMVTTQSSTFQAQGLTQKAAKILLAAVDSTTFPRAQGAFL